MRKISTLTIDACKALHFCIKHQRTWQGAVSPARRSGQIWALANYSINGRRRTLNFTSVFVTPYKYPRVKPCKPKPFRGLFLFTVLPSSTLYERNNFLKKLGVTMQLFKRMLVITAIVPLIAGLSGCASDLIEVRKGSDRVSLADASQVGSCQSKGEITVSVLAQVRFISRSVEEVEANLSQLARNGTIDAGGDTVVKGDSPGYGKRTFAIYKCRP